MGILCNSHQQGRRLDSFVSEPSFVDYSENLSESKNAEEVLNKEIKKKKSKKSLGHPQIMLDL